MDAPISKLSLISLLSGSSVKTAFSSLELRFFPSVIFPLNCKLNRLTSGKLWTCALGKTSNRTCKRPHLPQFAEDPPELIRLTN